MTFKRFVILSLWLLAGCAPAGGEATAVAPTSTWQIDDATGLPLNPATLPDSQFIVEGMVTAVTVIPQNKPLFKVQIPSGHTYQINAQPLGQITMLDGSAIRAIDFKSGMVIRATATTSDAGGLGGEPVLSSQDLVVLSLAE